MVLTEGKDDSTMRHRGSQQRIASLVYTSRKCFVAFIFATN